MPGHSSMSGLGLDGLAIRTDEHRGHHSEAAITLGNRVRLDVAVVVLASPDEAALGLHGLSHHVVNETVLVPDFLGLEGRLVVGLVDPGKDLHEEAVILLQDGVLGRHVERVAPVEGVLEAAVGEVDDARLRVVHAEGDAPALEIVDLIDLGFRSVRRLEDKLESTSSRDGEVGGLILKQSRISTLLSIRDF